MFLKDSLTNKLTELNKNKKIKIYSCGPTVYDYIHIGNARPLVLTDTIIRSLEFFGYQTDFLMNITDIDDKIINKAIEKNSKSKDISNEFTKAFIEDIGNLNINLRTVIPISDKMDEIIKFIENLINSENAYLKEGNVYFDISKLKDQYFLLSKQKEEELKSSDRDIIDNNSLKKNSLDFALWKKTDIGEKWESPFGEGRPGWHTECAVLIDDFFNDTIDLHIGGIDLKFPHHENERIQFIAKNKKELSRIWIYNGHINLDNKKMSKSIGNIYKLRDFLSDYGPNVLKYIFHTSNYSQPINITDELIANAEKWNKKIITFYKNVVLKYFNFSKEINLSFNLDLSKFEYIKKNLFNNLNTAMVVSEVDRIIKSINTDLNNNIFNDEDLVYLDNILKILGFKFRLPLISKEDGNLIKELNEKRKAGNFEQADKIKEILIKKEIL